MGVVDGALAFVDARIQRCQLRRIGERHVKSRSRWLRQLKPWGRAVSSPKKEGLAPKLGGVLSMGYACML